MIGWLINRLSGYQRDRVFQREMYASESERLVTDANGMLDRGEVVVSAVWQTDDTMTCHMSAPMIAINGKSVSVVARGQYSGRCRIRVDLTTSSDRKISAWHIIRVRPAPYFTGENWQNGPRRLVAEA